MSTQNLRRLISRVVLVVGFFMGLTIVPAALIGPIPPDWSPKHLTDWAFDVRLTVGTPLRAVLSMTNGDLVDKAVYLDTYGEVVSFASDTLKIAATLYRTPHEAGQPGIIFLHGSSPQGRNLGLYRVLGQRLADHGFAVLSLDQRGYGSSSDPPSVDDPAAFNYAGDVSHAIDYLTTLDGIDPERIYIVGHSFGGDVAITAGIMEPRLRKIVAIGPGRRFLERGGTIDAPELAYFRRRDMRYMGLREPIPEAVYLQSRARLPIENHLEYFNQPGHKPLMLVDGDLEGDADQQFLGDIYRQIVEPKAYKTLDKADHYANVGNIGPVVIYDRRAVDILAEEIHAWLLSD